MANITFLSENHMLESQVTVTTGTTNAQFPVDNIKSDFTTKQARIAPAIFGSSPQKLGVRLLFQLESDEMIDTIALVPNSITGFGFGSVSYKLSLTNSFDPDASTPVVNTIDLSSKYDFAIGQNEAELAKFVELTFEGVAGFAEISKIFIGKRLTLSTSFSQSSFARTINRNDDVTENAFGNRFVDIRNSRATIAGTLPLLEQTDLNIIEDLYARHNGFIPIWVLVDPDSLLFDEAGALGRFRLSQYSYFNNVFSHGFIGGGFFDVGMEFVEAI